MRSSGSRVAWKIFFVIFTKLIPREFFFCIAKILVLMVYTNLRLSKCTFLMHSGLHENYVMSPRIYVYVLFLRARALSLTSLLLLLLFFAFLLHPNRKSFQDES